MIKCKHIWYIFGNHCKRKQCIETFGEQRCSDLKVSKFSNKEKVVMAHYAMYVWPASHYGSYMLYGHSHSMIEDKLDNLFPNRRSMDVGLDNYFRLFGTYEPFSEKEILDILGPRNGHDSLEFYREKEKTWKKESLAASAQ